MRCADVAEASRAWSGRPGLLRGLFLVLFLALAWLDPAMAQTRPLRVGLLFLGTPDTNAEIVETLKSEFQILGYQENRNLVLLPRYAFGDAAKVPDLARDLAAEGASVILTGGERNLILIQKAVPQVPTVVVACDAVQKLIATIRTVGGNATGFGCVSADLYGKRIGYLVSALQGIDRLALLYNPNDIAEDELSAAEEARIRFNINELGRFPVTSPAEIRAALQRMQAEGYKALYVSFNAFTFVHAKLIAELSLSHGIAAISSVAQFPDNGALMSYGASLLDGYRRAAYFADRIHRGAPASTLPVEQPTKFYLVINQRTAAALHVSIPELLLAGADRVIE